MNPIYRLISLPEEELEVKGLKHTPKEILSQPNVWMKNFEMLKGRKSEIEDFIEDRVLSKKTVRVILSGAGSSHFIGLSSEDLLRRMWLVDVESRASTDIVTSWESILLKHMDTVLISFSRSGNSPESLGAFLLADKYCERISHIIVTCNRDGSLVSLKSRNEDAEDNVLRIVLSEEANDKGLAMTVSFTTMLMAAQFLAHIHKLNEYEEVIRVASKAAEKLLNEYSSILKEVADMNFDRSFFLGTGPLYGCAAESHLKLQELSAGQIACKFDSFLGVRHGPEIAINNRTLVVCFISSNPLVRRYELDLMEDLHGKGLGLRRIAVCCGLNDQIERYVDYVINIDVNNGSAFPDMCRPVVDVIVGQMLGLFKSINLGLKPDKPSEKDVITRVVKGVKIYDPEKFKGLENSK